MKLSLAIFATSLSFLLSASQGMAFQERNSLPATRKAAMAEAPAKIQAEAPENEQRGMDGEKRFPFGHFQETEWSEVIPTFCDDAGFSLQNVDEWPKGTFSLKDKDKYTALEALDQLNRSLAGLSQPFTLI